MERLWKYQKLRRLADLLGEMVSDKCSGDADLGAKNAQRGTNLRLISLMEKLCKIGGAFWMVPRETSGRKTKKCFRII